MKPGTAIFFVATQARSSPIPEVDFSRLPAPSEDLSKEKQREMFCGAYGGPRPLAEADFEAWWRAHRGD